MSEFEPRILAFLCNWCSYPGADLAGVSRIQYPTNVRSIRTMCSARVDPVMVFEGFLQSMDGVTVLGCHLGDCHYYIGNYFTVKRMKMTSALLEVAGIVPERFYLDWCSAAEGERFAKLITEFTNRVREIGPLGEPESLSSDELKIRFLAAQKAADTERIRTLVGKELLLLEEGNVYGEKADQNQYDRVLGNALEEEFINQRIALALTDKELSVVEIAGVTGISPDKVLQSIAEMEHSQQVALARIEEMTPKYQLTEP